MILLLAVFVPFFGALVAPLASRRLGARAGWLLALSFVPGLLLVRLGDAARSGTPTEATLAWVPDLGLELTLRADGFSLMFALLVAAIGVLVTIYAASYLHPRERHGRFYGYLLLFGGAMMGLVLADNLIALFAFWELTSVASFLLIGFWDDRKESQDGAVKALLVTALGGLALLVAVVLLMLASGGARLSALDAEMLRSSPLFAPAVVLLLVAAFTKSAQLPFHLWLPTAMEAPTPVSAYLHSATMVKAGVILIAKLGFLFDGTVFATATLAIGLATMFWGSYLAIRQNDLKALLAYSTVSQLGILTALYGAGHAQAATAHLINHAAFKAALFLVVGIIDHEAGTRDIRRLGGLARRLPLTFLLAFPAALSMAGLPPFGGFISKELFYEEMLRDGVLPIFIAVAGSVMTFAYSLRFLSVFFGPLRSNRPDVHEPTPLLWLPVLPLSLATIAFGLVPWQNTVAVWFTALAAPTFGYPLEKLTLWHGFNVILALSVLTWSFGLALHLLRDRFVALQQALTPSWDANTIYYRLLLGLEQLAAGVTRRTQGAPFATHVRFIWLALALLGAIAVWRLLPAGYLATLTPVPLEMVAVAVLLLASIGGVLLARRRLSALIFMGLAGLGSTLAFVQLRAPDLALTQLLIETVTVILFLSVFRYLPRLTRYHRPPQLAAFDALLALGVTAVVFVLLVAVQQPIAPRIEEFFLAFSKELAGGYNVVNVILVDFRGYDTMGEITVLAIVAVSVFALLKLRARQPEPSDDEAEEVYEQVP